MKPLIYPVIFFCLASAAFNLGFVGHNSRDILEVAPGGKTRLIPAGSYALAMSPLSKEMFATGQPNGEGRPTLDSFFHGVNWTARLRWPLAPEKVTPYEVNYTPDPKTVGWFLRQQYGDTSFPQTGDKLALADNIQQALETIGVHARVTIR